jgi:iron complex transport system substrate-binding protein
MIGSVLSGPRVAIPAAAGALLLAVVAVACGERAEPIGPGARVYPVTILDDADRPVTIVQPARRVALLDPSLEPLFTALGAGSQIAGTPVTAGGALRADRLARLQPDLVVAAPGEDDALLSKAARIAKAPVYVLPGTSIREVERGITQAGLITGRPLAARQLVHRIETARRTVRAHLDTRRLTSVFVDIGGFRGATDQSLIGDLVREARGRNVSGRGGISPIAGVSEIVRANPEVYVALASSGTDLGTLRDDKRARRLAAVRNGRVVVIADRLLTPGPAIGRGLVALARALHPDAMP